MPQQYLPVLLCIALAFGLGIVLLALSWFAGRQTGGEVKRSTYESGLPLLDHSRKRLSVVFFLVALDFVIWALVVREGGWPLLGAIGVFLAFLLAGFFYIWRKGGLEVRTGAADPGPTTP